MRFLAQRDRQPEMMDQPGLDADAHHSALDGLRAANSISRTARVIWRSMMHASIRLGDGSPLRILDIAAGGGDVMIGIAKMAARRGVAIEAYGCDINSTAIEHAGNAAKRAQITNAKFFQLNALIDPLPEAYDVLMCTLFLHHLSEADARDLLRRMAYATKQCVLIDDLQRTRLGYYYAWAGGRLMTRSRIVHTDGPLSVRAAFTIPEVRQLACDAGLPDARFRRHWPQRFVMTWKKHE